MRLIILAPLLLAACAEPGEPARSPSPPAVCMVISPVYHPSRLKQLEPCVLFRGVVVANLREPDGDRHLWLAPDPGYERFLNAANVSRGQKALVAEIVPACTSEPTNEEAAAQCPRSALGSPIVGSHVEITGPWVLDIVHGWNEIHPVVSLKVLPRT